MGLGEWAPALELALEEWPLFSVVHCFLADRGGFVARELAGLMGLPARHLCGAAHVLEYAFRAGAVAGHLSVAGTHSCMSTVPRALADAVLVPPSLPPGAEARARGTLRYLRSVLDRAGEV
jgi:hypothetical protein